MKLAAVVLVSVTLVAGVLGTKNATFFEAGRACDSCDENTTIKEFSSNQIESSEKKRILEKSLEVKGDNGRPRSAFPLGLCEGDCDRDRDCDRDLKCFKRRRFDPVPGCSGSGERGKDYVCTRFFF